MAFFMEDMLSRKSIFAHAKETYLYAFRKSGFSDYVKENASSNNITLVTVDDLFEFGHHASYSVFLRLQSIIFQLF